MTIKMIYKGILIAMGISFVASLALGQEMPRVVAESEIEAGRYLVKIGGCNDCHTAGYGLSGGKVPETDWLMGDVLGFRGPWGTTYATNLRLYVQEVSEDDWVKRKVFTKAKPPMPSFNLTALSESDLRAMYRFIKHLGEKGVKAPAYVPPNQEPQPPYVQWPSPPPQ